MAVAGGYQAYQAKEAKEDARDAANRQDALQREAMERNKPKQAGRAPDKGAFYADEAAGGGGISSGLGGTLLTGPSGVAPGTQNIGQRTLLG
jgi:hypothetical protein